MDTAGEWWKNPSQERDKKAQESKAISKDISALLESDFSSCLKKRLAPLDCYLEAETPSLIHWNARVMIDANPENIHRQGGIYQAFSEALLQTLQEVIGEELFVRLKGIYREKQFLISTEAKRKDYDPFLDDRLRTRSFNDQNIASMYASRTPFNHAEVQFYLYPEKLKQGLHNLLATSSSIQNL